MSYKINSISVVPPPGSIVSYVGSSIPEGWLLCNGSAISRVTYSALFSIIQTNFGGGDGSTTFNLPNYQGAFLRGAGTQTHSSITYGYLTGTTTARTINTAQGTSTQTHNHGVTDPGHSHGVTDGGHTHSVNDPGHSHGLSTLYNAIRWSDPRGDRYLPGGSGTRGRFPSGVDSTTIGMTINSGSSNGVAANAANSNISINNSTTNVDINETRPFNYAIYWIIKY